MKLTRILAQIRMASNKRVKFTCNGSCYHIDTEAVCSVCNMMELESLDHLIFRCPVYDQIRPTAIKGLRDMNGLVAVLNDMNVFYFKIVGYFVVNLLKLRSFIFNE